MTTIKSVHESKIDWCTHTCNIITGCLGPAGDGQHCQTPEGIEYCYAKPFANRIYRKPLGKGKEFEPHFWRERLDGIELAPAGARIFMNSMGDAFGDWVPKEFIQTMLRSCLNPKYTFYFLTKNPKRYFEKGIKEFFDNNENLWTGFTATDGNDYFDNWGYFQPKPRKQVFVSMEPMFDAMGRLDCFKSHSKTYEIPTWIIVGPQTNPLRLPELEWIEGIKTQTKFYGTYLFMKDKLASLYDGKENLIQEIPHDN